jgi:hypothetical protein
VKTSAKLGQTADGGTDDAHHEHLRPKGLAQKTHTQDVL